MTQDPHPFRIVVAIDFSEPSRLALVEAANMAALRGAELHPVHVVDDAPDPITGRTDVTALDHRFETATTRAREFIDAELAELKQRLGAFGTLGQRVTFHVRAGAPAAQVVDLAASLDADLIVVSTHGLRGLARLVMGSVSEKVVRLAHCPVLIVRPKAHPKPAEAQLEPLCADCAKLRADSGNPELWCPRHTRPHPHAHRFSYMPVAPTHGSMKFND